MVLRQKLTPETFLEAPRRSAAVPSPSGRVAYFTVSTHTFLDGGNAQGTTKKELFLMDLGTGEAWPFAVTNSDNDNDVSKIGDIAWVPSSDDKDELLWLRPAIASPYMPAGSTEIVVAAATYGPYDDLPAKPYVAGNVPAPISALRLKALPDGSVAFAVAGLVGKDGELFNEKAPMAAVPSGSEIPENDKLIEIDFDPSSAPPSTSSPSSTSSLAPPQPGSTARIYDTWQVRAWDSYIKPQPYAIWYSNLVQQPSLSTFLDDHPMRWSLASPLHNALQHAPARFEAPFTIYEPGDATQSYDIGAQGVVFVVRDPAPANPLHTSCSEVYYVPLDSFSAPTAYKPAKITIAASTTTTASSTSAFVPGLSGNPPGLSANPRFSPDGTMLAFLWAPLACPANERVYMGHIVSGAVYDVVSTVINGPGSSSQSPSSSFSDSLPIPYAFEFAPSGKAVFFEAHDCGRRSLFVMDLRAGARPRLVSGKQGSVAAYHLVPKQTDSGRRGGRGGGGGGRGRTPSDRLSAYSVLLSGSSFVESSFYHMVDLEDNDNLMTSGSFEPRVVSTASKDGARFGLSYDKQVSEMYFEGGGDGYCVQAWVMRPSQAEGEGEGGHPTTQKYPLALLVHGGPESAFDDEWHMRWNAAVWAEQGYIVVMPNITGSVGFGLEHTTRIYNSWGGYPYEDLVKCMAYLRDVPDIDCDRAIVAGASYGGYMVAWLHGSPLGKQFNAAVCHDPVFSTEFMGLTSDFPDGIATFKGPGYSWTNFDNVNRWNPARPDRLAAWKTHAAPTLVVHSDRDYRCVVTEGQAVFRVLLFQGVPARYLNFPDESHFVTKPENALVWHRVVFEWVNRWREVKRGTGGDIGA